MKKHIVSILLTASVMGSALGFHNSRAQSIFYEKYKHAMSENARIAQEATEKLQEAQELGAALVAQDAIQSAGEQEAMQVFTAQQEAAAKLAQENAPFYMKQFNATLNFLNFTKIQEKLTEFVTEKPYTAGVTALAALGLSAYTAYKTYSWFKNRYKTVEIRLIRP